MSMLKKMALSEMLDKLFGNFQEQISESNNECSTENVSNILVQ